MSALLESVLDTERKSAADSFDCLLRELSRSQSVIDRATVYRARVGRRREFKSEADAHAYERGFDGFPAVPAFDGPEMTGYHDANQAFVDQEGWRIEAAQARSEE